MANGKPLKELMETAIQSHYWPEYEDTVDYTDGLGMTHHLTIRAVTAEEFIRRYQARSTHLADIKAVPLIVKDKETLVAKSTSPKDYCPIHKVKMKEYTKRDQKWFSHQTEDPRYEKGWCNGKLP